MDCEQYFLGKPRSDKLSWEYRSGNRASLKESYTRSKQHSTSPTPTLQTQKGPTKGTIKMAEVLSSERDAELKRIHACIIKAPISYPLHPHYIPRYTHATPTPHPRYTHAKYHATPTLHPRYTHPTYHATPTLHQRYTHATYHATPMLHPCYTRAVHELYTSELSRLFPWCQASRVHELDDTHTHTHAHKHTHAYTHKSTTVRVLEQRIQTHV